MKTFNILLICAVFALLMSACSSDSNIAGTTPSGPGNNTGTNINMGSSSIREIAMADPGADPLEISDTDALAQDIAETFGGANDEPVEVEEGDDLDTVFARAN